MKKQEKNNDAVNFRNAWNDVKNEVGTINSNLVILFDIAKNPQNKEFAKIFATLLGDDFATLSNKQVNSHLYKIVKTKYPEVGEMVTKVKMIKGNKTEIQERKRISVYHTFLALYQEAKRASKKA